MDEQNNKLEIDLLPLREAMDYAQSLESRGDFKYKGIYSIFNTVYEMTSKFREHRILPDVFQLQKDLSLPKDKFEEYINELTGRGSLKSMALIMFPSVDFIAGNNLTKLIILCRPIQSDGSSYSKYFDHYKSRSIDAIKKWYQKKGSKWQGLHRDYIIKNLNEKNYPNSHAGAVIHYYLENPLDKTLEEKTFTYKNFIKPIIRDLIQEKLLLYVREESNFYTILFADEESLIDRMGMLINRLAQENSIFEFTGEINFQNLENYKNKIKKVENIKNISLYLELKINIEELIKIFKQKEEQEKKQKILRALEELSKYDWVIPANYIKSLNKENLPEFISHSEVLHTEFFFGNKIEEFFLYKKNIYPAVVHARKQLAEKNDDTEMKILMQMQVYRFLDGEQLKIYRSAEEQVLFLRLPWYVRIIRALFGRNKIKEEEKEKLKEDIRREELEKQVSYKRKEIQKQTKELVRKKIEKQEDREKPAVDLYEEDVKKLKQSIQKDEKVEQLVNKVLDILDTSWDNKELPNRITLLEKVEEFQNNEDYLIQFLKKHCKGKIFSFRIIPNNPNSPKINLNDPKYVWPVLITKRYIIKNGNKLLKQAMEESDAQRKALMPNQEVFDVAIAIEDFLTRILTSNKK